MVCEPRGLFPLPVIIDQVSESLFLSRVYLLEGLVTMALAFVVWFILPDYPRSKRSSKWLAEREQLFIEARLSEHAPKTSDPAFSLHETRLALKDPRLWAFMVSQVCQKPPELKVIVVFG